MKFTAEMIASFLNGEIVGNKDAAVSSVAKIEEAKDGDLAFLANLKYENFIYTTKASIVIVNRDFVPSASVSATLIKVDDSYSCFAQLLELYDAEKNSSRVGVSLNSSIDNSVTLDDSAYVGDYVVIESGVKLGSDVKIFAQSYIGKNVTLGNNVKLYSGVKIYDDCIIGNNVIIHSGSVIGADGFGFAPQSDGTYKKIPQIGNVVIEDGVEIGANTCIDRATMGSTMIKKGVKLDNLIQIAHNVVVNEDTVIAAQCGVAGSSVIGSRCMFAGQVGIAGHLKVANETIIASQSGIAGSVKTEGQVLMGTPAYNAKDWQRAYISSKSLPEMSSRLRTMEKELEELKSLIKTKLQ